MNEHSCPWRDIAAAQKNEIHHLRSEVEALRREVEDGAESYRKKCEEAQRWVVRHDEQAGNGAALFQRALAAEAEVERLRNLAAGRINLTLGGVIVYQHIHPLATEYDSLLSMPIDRWVGEPEGSIDRLAEATAALASYSARTLAAEAEVERLAAAENEVDARLEAAEARIGVLEGALDGVWCAMSSKGEKCWCAYERIIHPQDDPQDALTLEPNGHTKECNTARSALGGGEGEK